MDETGKLLLRARKSALHMFYWSGQIILGLTAIVGIISLMPLFFIPGFIFSLRYGGEVILWWSLGLLAVSGLVILSTLLIFLSNLNLRPFEVYENGLKGIVTGVIRQAILGKDRLVGWERIERIKIWHPGKNPPRVKLRFVLNGGIDTHEMELEKNIDNGRLLSLLGERAAGKMEQMDNGPE